MIDYEPSIRKGCASVFLVKSVLRIQNDVLGAHRLNGAYKTYSSRLRTLGSLNIRKKYFRVSASQKLSMRSACGGLERVTSSTAAFAMSVWEISRIAENILHALSSRTGSPVIR